MFVPNGSVANAILKQECLAGACFGGLSRLINKDLYTMGKLVGKGGFGEVRRGISWRKVQNVAIKRVRHRDAADREYEIQRRLDHENIAKVYDVTERGKDSFIVMELVNGVDLLNYMARHGGRYASRLRHRLSECDAKSVFRKIIDAVTHCHEHKVAHCDLKPENILIENVCNRVKLIDFGLSIVAEEGAESSSICGTLPYCAPEVLSGKCYDWLQADVWSLGILLYEMLTGVQPFGESKSRILEGVFHMPKMLSDEVQELIAIILTVDTGKRLTLAEIRDHAWFLNSNEACMEVMN